MKRSLFTGIVYLAIGLVPIGLRAWPAPLANLSAGEGLESFLATFPFVALAAAGLMGWRLRQTRILLVSLVYLGVFAYLRRLGVQPEANRDALALALPLSLAFVAGSGESPLVDRRFAVRTGLAALPFALFGALSAWGPGLLARIAGWSPGTWSRPLGLPLFALAGAVACGALAGSERNRGVRPFMSALAISTIPFLFAVRALGEEVLPLPIGIHTSTAFTALSLALLYSVLSLTWDRVYLDGLTGLPNRRALDEKLEALAGTYSVAMVDIDLFKAYNDEFGHDQGDEVLRMVAGHLEMKLGGRVHRYGGEEFCVVFEGETPDAVSALAEECRRTLDARVFHIRAPRPNPLGPTLSHVRKGQAIGVSVSVGVAHSVPGLSVGDIVKKADEALYAAKRAGRNRVVVSS